MIADKDYNKFSVPMNRAIELAEDLIGKVDVCHGCVLTDRRLNIIGEGQNSYTKTHPKQAEYAWKYGNPQQVHLHAEIDALIRCKKPRETFLFVARVFPSTRAIGLSKPCRICSGAIKNSSNIQRVFYTMADGWYYYNVKRS